MAPWAFPDSQAEPEFFTGKDLSLHESPEEHSTEGASGSFYSPTRPSGPAQRQAEVLPTAGQTGFPTQAAQAQSTSARPWPPKVTVAAPVTTE